MPRAAVGLLLLEMLIHVSRSLYLTSTILPSYAHRVSSFRVYTSSSSNVNDNAVSNSNVKPFWYDGLKFGCTGCGRCCQNEGEVWMDSDEVTRLVMSMKLPIEDLLDNYVEEVKSGWIKLKSKRNDPLSETTSSGLVEAKEQCIFLGSDGKVCMPWICTVCC